MRSREEALHNSRTYKSIPMKRANRFEQHLKRLELLEKSGLYNTGALKAIFLKLSGYELKLSSKRSGAGIILAYAAFAQNLELLHYKRKQREGKVESSSTKFNPFTGLIFSIYKRGLARFHDDLELWMSFLRYSTRKGAHKLISRALVQALRFNPGSGGLWAFAASWEFHAQVNPSGARTLLHRGLRACSGTQALWREYFEFELKYTERIRNRQSILNTRHENETVHTESSKSEATAQSRLGMSSLSARDGSIAAGVYTAAKKQNADSLTFLLYFLIRVSKIKWAGQLQKLIYDDIMKTYPTSAHEIDLILAMGNSEQKGQLMNILSKHTLAQGPLWKYSIQNLTRITPDSLCGNCFSSLQEFDVLNMFVARSASNRTANIIGSCNNYEQYLLCTQRFKYMRLDNYKSAEVVERAPSNMFQGFYNGFVKIESAWLQCKLRFDVRLIF